MLLGLARMVRRGGVGVGVGGDKAGLLGWVLAAFAVAQLAKAAPNQVGAQYVTGTMTLDEYDSCTYVAVPQRYCSSYVNCIRTYTQANQGGNLATFTPQAFPVSSCCPVISGTVHGSTFSGTQSAVSFAGVSFGQTYVTMSVTSSGYVMMTFSDGVNSCTNGYTVSSGTVLGTGVYYWYTYGYYWFWVWLPILLFCLLVCCLCAHPRTRTTSRGMVYQPQPPPAQAPPMVMEMQRQPIVEAIPVTQQSGGPVVEGVPVGVGGAAPQYTVEYNSATGKYEQRLAQI